MGAFKKGHLVPIEWRKAVSKTQKGCKRSEEFKRKRSEAQKKLWQNPEYREHMSKALSKPRRPFSEETKKRMSQSQWIKKLIARGLPHPQKGKPNLKYRGENNPAKRPEVRAKISQKKKEELKHHPERWLNAKLARLGKATKPQLQLFNIVRQKFPDAQLNYRIPNTRRFADIGIPSEKLDIEFDGEYWHKDKDADAIRDKEIVSARWAILHTRQHHLDNHEVEALFGINDYSLDNLFG